MAGAKQTALDAEIDEIIAGERPSAPKKSLGLFAALKKSFAPGKSGCGSCVKCGPGRSLKKDDPC
ncbi:MAG TPA: hypothetical protein HPQ04_12330 [Rhodospirillaceae bacterium]|nr:hypothetical protein [Rhodospirillaceae bacterium]